MSNNTWGKIEGKKNSTTPFDVDMIQRTLFAIQGKSLKDCEILDYGSGEGRILSELISNDLANPDKVCGRDISFEIVERCKTEHPGFADKVAVMEPAQTGLKANSIDFATLMGVGVCNPEDEDFNSILFELYRVLKNKGVLYITDFLETGNMKDTYDKYHQEHPGYDYGVYENKDGMKFIHRSLGRFLLLCRMAGFTTVESQLVTITSINGHEYNGIKMTLVK